MLGRADASTMKLAMANAHPLDSRVEFEEEEHIYTVDGVAIGCSVTTLIKEVDSDPFDPERVAERVASMSSPKAKYWLPDAATGKRRKMTAPEILQAWNDARDLGTHLHGMIERYLNEIPVSLKDGDANAYEFGQFLTWWQMKKWAGYRPFRTEWVIYDASSDLAGSIDFVMEREGKYTIVDWKRCETSGSGFDEAFGGKRFLPPLAHMPLHKLNKWKVQTNVYAEILRTQYGLDVEGLVMVVCHEELPSAAEYWHDRDPCGLELINLRRAARSPPASPYPRPVGVYAEPPLANCKRGAAASGAAAAAYNSQSTSRAKPAKTTRSICDLLGIEDGESEDEH